MSFSLSQCLRQKDRARFECTAELIAQAENDLHRSQPREEETPWFVRLFRDGDAAKNSGGTYYRQKSILIERDRLFISWAILTPLSPTSKKAIQSSVTAHEAVAPAHTSVFDQGLAAAHTRSQYPGMCGSDYFEGHGKRSQRPFSIDGQDGEGHRRLPMKFFPR